jgi:TonB-linked SusC/RagA family outer membrane protein
MSNKILTELPMKKKSMQLMGLRKVFAAVFTFILLCFATAIQAQNINVSGTVTDASGEALIGVNVLVKGTTLGTITNVDGAYTLSVPNTQSVLVFSYVGFVTQEITVGTQRSINVQLIDDSRSLEEVVVVGYGVQKKKLVTGATVQVSGDDIQKLSTVTALGALQSQTPGVNIVQNTGKPGAGYKVTIRGIGTTGSSSPLYVVDGVTTGADINNLNPADIESVDVLKDAASAAIYGARAANGVILVTTKQGKAGKMQLSYDTYYAVQNLYKRPATLNAKEYMSMLEEIRFNEGRPEYDWSKELPAYLLTQINNGTWEGTDWLDEYMNKDATVQNHAINLTGGSEISRFALGFSYNQEEGIFGKPVQPQLKRYTARVNSEHVLLKVRDFNAITIGENLLFTYRSTFADVATGNKYWNALKGVINNSPLLPVYNSEGEFYGQADKVAEGWNLQGAMGNPIAASTLGSWTNNFNRSMALSANAYVEIQPIKNLKFRSVFGFGGSSWTWRAYDAPRWLSTTDIVTVDTNSQNGGGGYSISLENTLSYNFVLDQQHTFDVVVGQSLEKGGMGESLSASAKNSLFPGQFKYAYVDNAKPTALTEIGAGGSPYGQGRLLSFFGRVNYNYKEKYMASAILRADGSSNFARGHRWGYFPSVSAGWVITNEAFMESVRDNGLDFFKLRVSWGQNGNASISNFQYIATIAMNKSNDYYFGDSKESPTTGAYADVLPNPDVTWETSEQLDFGFDARVLNSRLGINFDLYRKTTKDWLVVAPQLASYGTGAPYINGGDVRNTGIELGLNWNDRAGDFNYSINFNIAHNVNEVTRIANNEGIIHGPAEELGQEFFRAQVGYPIGYFWGYKTEGVFQNQAQIDAYRAAGKGVIDGAQPGDMIFADTNNDGGISYEDKVMLGNPHPDFTSGLTASLEYKGLDFSITTYGAFGQQIAKFYRAWDGDVYENYTTDIFGRWHGEGTSNKLPRLTMGSHSNWQYLSDIYFEDGDYVKISNVTVGYDFKKLFKRLPFSQVRLYVAALNLYTFTGYSGMDPEIGFGYDNYPWASGIDIAAYPSTRKYMVGLNLKF